MDRHRELLALAGRAPDGWLLIAREALADDDTDRLEALLEVLPEEKAKARPHTFAQEPGGYEKTDRALVKAVREHASACWATTRDGTDRVYLVQAAPGADRAALTAAGQHALTSLEDTPKVEVFGEDDPLPAYHERALLAATLLWTAADQSSAGDVRVARAFDGAGVRGPWFGPDHELVVDPAERERLLEFLSGGEVVLTVTTRMPDLLTGARDVVPVSLRSDGTWVWSDATGYYLDRHQLAPDPELAAYAMASAGRARNLTPLTRHHVRVALTPTDQEGPTWRAE